MSALVLSREVKSITTPEGNIENYSAAFDKIENGSYLYRFERIINEYTIDKDTNKKVYVTDKYDPRILIQLKGLDELTIIMNDPKKYYERFLKVHQGYVPYSLYFRIIDDSLEYCMEYADDFLNCEINKVLAEYASRDELSLSFHKYFTKEKSSSIYHINVWLMPNTKLTIEDAKDILNNMNEE